MHASLQQTLDFLRDLQFNNNRAWFNENRKRYEAARAAAEQLTLDLVKQFGEVDDIGELSPSDAMFRLNRDTRFSPDKTPYKTNIGIVLGREGRKTTGRSYYVQIQPDGNSFIAGGLYMPSSEELAAVRQAIAEDSRPMRTILETESFKRYFGTMGGEQVKTAPKGYAKTHPDIDLLRYKQYLAVHHLTDEQVVADDLVDYIIEVCKALKPFASYFPDVLRVTN